jgi:4-hydroxy-tetrahydrodipicolinate synthase
MIEDNQASRRTFLEKAVRGVLGMALTFEMTDSLGAVSGHFASRYQPHESDIKQTDGKKLIPVMITPLKSDLKIDYDGVSRVTDFYLAAGAHGLFANCLSSEMFFMDDAERLALTKHVVKYVNSKVSVVSTGSFGKTLEEKAKNTNEIYDTGVNAVILISGQLAGKEDSDDVLIANFEKFFNLTGNVPLGTYECPQPYKRIITPKVFKYLVNNNRVIYHKDTCEDIGKIKEKLKLLRGSKLEFYNAHTASGLASMQMGGNGMSPISANFYPEILAWLCANATNESKSEETKWIQSEIATMEPVISKFYPLSSKYFLSKRGLPIELFSRSKSKKIPVEQQLVLDNAYKTFLGWCDRLSIKPVRV